MNLELVDIQGLAVVQDSLSELTGFSFSTYDDRGHLLIPPKYEDKLLAFIKSHAAGREEYGDFVRKGIEMAAMRKEISLFKGPADQHHLFIPSQVDGCALVLVGGAFYPSNRDFEEFYMKKGQSYGLAPSQLQSWSQKITVRDYETIQSISTHIKLLLNTVLRCGYERNLNHKRYRWAKTIIDVLSNIQQPITTGEVYSLMVDALLFLLNVDTVSVMVKDGALFKPMISAGRSKGDVESVFLKEEAWMISRSIKGRSPVSCNDNMEILRLGFPDNIASIHLFPIFCKENVFGVLGIFNSLIAKEESECISDLCNLVGFVLRNTSLQTVYDAQTKNIAALNLAATSLPAVLHTPDALYETIVDTTTRLLKAERGSLMLPDEDRGELSIKAVKGINKWLTRDIKIKIGEGVAGKVFKEGIPLLVENIEKIEALHIKPRPHYKGGSFVCIPLKVGEETIGVLNISDKTTGEVFSEQDLALLSYFAPYASIALKASNYYSLAEQMKELSITDSLTGLFNRRYFYDRFIEEIQRSVRHDLPFSLAMLDIDDFKLFNDTEGHLAGDDVLKGIAHIARESLRVNDVLARFGGEEFTVIMPQTAKDEAYLVAERIRRNIQELLLCTWKTFPRRCITVSVGVATFPDDGKDTNELTRNADRALYIAKMEGKNRTTVWKKSD